MPWPIDADDRDRPAVSRDSQFRFGGGALGATLSASAGSGPASGSPRENSRRNRPDFGFSGPSSFELIDLPNGLTAAERLHFAIAAKAWRATKARIAIGS
jgi:hypothetical protein